MQIGGIPNCPLCTSQIGNSLPKTSVIAVPYHSQGGALEIIFYVFVHWQSFIYTLKSIPWQFQIKVLPFKVCASFHLKMILDVFLALNALSLEYRGCPWLI